MSFPVTITAEQVSFAAGTMTTLFNTGLLHLFTAVDGGTIDPSGDATQFTEAVYTGYAAQAVAAWSGPFLDAGNVPAIAMPSHAFPGPGDATGQTILGCYYIDSGADLAWAALFDTPASLLTVLSLLIVSAQVTVAGSGWVSTEGSNLP